MLQSPNFAALSALYKREQNLSPMQKDQPVCISLTAAQSHKITIPAGQGSFSIGTKGISKGKYDTWVEKGEVIQWNCFDEFSTPAGSRWPRFLYYAGNDNGFVEWSDQRPVEDFHWFPYESVSADLTKADIGNFHVHSAGEQVELTLGSKIRRLYLSGNLAQFQIKQSAQIPYLHFSPDTAKKEIVSYKLPVFRNFEQVPHIDVNVPPVGQAFDCKSLLQFTNLKSLSLSGNLTNLHELKELKHLESIELRYVPDLAAMPALTTWPQLTYFIGWNIEEEAGKVLKKELQQLSKESVFTYASVSKLKKKIWFTTEYGILFAGWADKNAKLATKAYKTALKEISKAKTEDEVKASIGKVIRVINTLPDIETTEREDAGLAVDQLIQSSSLSISSEKANQWFNEYRDF
ncbi:hypothetical protein ACR78F_11525 [Sphingobacterium spiritivorum]